jgi:hypothetical protein
VLTWCDQQRAPYGPPMIVLHVFYSQRVLVILQKNKATCILKHTIIEGEGSSRLIVLSSFSSFFFLHVSSVSFVT